jgi:hypothetical protein
MWHSRFDWVSVLRRQRAGLASAAAVMIGVKAMANMARVDPILTRSGHSSRYAIDIAWARCFGPGQMVDPMTGDRRLRPGDRIGTAFCCSA